MPLDIEILREKQSQGAIDLISTLRSVEINPVEICNRVCSFCPRGNPDIYPNQKYKIDLGTVKKIADDLQSFNYDGRIGFVGFGEPLLFKELYDCLKIIKDTVKNAKWIEVNTNGDYLTREIAENLIEAGCTHITVSMYDKDDSMHFKKIVEGLTVSLTLRHQYDSKNNYNINIVNRSDLAKSTSNILELNRVCYLPFYKMFIDHNGDVLVCNNDWGRNSNLGNVLTTSILDIWLGHTATEYRKHLIVGNRKNCSPCNRCNINGMHHGEESVEIFKKTIS